VRPDDDRLDPSARLVVDVLDQLYPRVDVVDSAVEARRMVSEIPRPDEVDAVARTEDRDLPGPDSPVPARVYWPSSDGATRPGVVYFHGGGWVTCGLDTHDGGCRRLANAVDAVVVSVDYRLAPEHKYPAATEDAYAALEWLSECATDLGVDPLRLAVAGDSAGGNLSAAVAQMTRDRGGPPLAFQLLVYPVVDSSATRNDYPSKTENAEGYFFTTRQMEWYRDQYLPDDAAGEAPYVSPHLASSLRDLPPACVVLPDCDPLRDEGARYAQMLDAAGVPVTVHRAGGMFHGFFNMDAMLEGAKAAQEVAYGAMRSVLQPGTSG
jgi:acetyl esterase